MLIYSLFTFIFTVFVIIWGALVRATHSGAGCGANWPLCNGEVIPLSSELETIIEFVHRSTSGLSVVFVFILLLFTFREYPKGSFSRSAAICAMSFMLVEVAIGASIVLFEWVKDNTSVFRAVMVAFHLVNSFLLIASLASHVLSVSYSRTIILKRPLLFSGTIFARVLLFSFLLVSSAGAITALGDTLFPPESFRTDFYMYLSPANHFLVQLRIIHPIFAVLLSLFILKFTLGLGEDKNDEGFYKKPNRLKKAHLAILNTNSLRYLVFFLLLLQLIIGPLTIILLAPVYLQLAHLFVSVMLWSFLVLLVMEDEFQNH